MRVRGVGAKEESTESYRGAIRGPDVAAFSKPGGTRGTLRSEE